jgi:uncharacterized protein YdcH (DUF465 family)
LALEKVKENISSLYKKTESAFFERFNTYQELDEIVNTDIHNCDKYDGNYFDKALLGLTLSRLLKDKINQTIKETYLDQVGKYLPGDVPKFLGLIDQFEKDW